MTAPLSRPLLTVVLAGLVVAAICGTPVQAAAADASVPTSGALTAFTFPVSPAAAASYGRVHHDYPATDMFAACGTAVVSPVPGRVSEVSRVDRWDPATDRGADRGGLSVAVVTADGMRFYGSHLRAVTAGIEVGVTVRAGQRLGDVGRTGSARATGCHLHFGLSPACGNGDWQTRRGVLYPWPYLDSWRDGGSASPAAPLAAWAAEHGCRPMTRGAIWSDGAFVRVTTTGGVYRVAGGTPLLLSTCVDGCPGRVETTEAAVSGSPRPPLPGTFVRAVETGGVYRVAGGAALWLPACVDGCTGRVDINQRTVDTQLARVPAEGTLLAAVDNGRVYRIIGGRPVWLRVCPPEGCRAAVRVFQASLDRIG